MVTYLKSSHLIAYLGKGGMHILHNFASSRQQQIGLKYYDEFIERIPRKEVDEIESVVKGLVKEINHGLIVLTCGSYRRGKSTCGDVDCLVSHPDGKSHKGVFQQVRIFSTNSCANRQVTPLNRDRIFCPE